MGNWARQMSQVLTAFSLVTQALVHQEKWLELMRFAQLRRNILMLWASEGHPMALALENRETTRKLRCHPLCGRVTSPPSLRGPICAPCLLRGSSGLGMLFLPGPPRPASGGLMRWLVPVLNSTSQSPASTPLPTWLASGRHLPSEPRWILPSPGGPRRLPTSVPGQPLLSAFPSTFPRQRFGGQVRSLEPAFPVCKCGVSSPAREQCRGWALHSAWYRAHTQ